MKLLNLKYQRYNTKIRKERGKSYWKNEEISGWKAHTNTWKLNWKVSTIRDVFLDQKRVNVCEHTVKMVPRVFTNIYSLLIEKDICDRRNISVCLRVPFIRRSLHFFGKSFPFFSVLWSFLSKWFHST